MSGSYCPDCGAQCTPGDNLCPDCKFPLTLKTILSEGGVRIPSSEMPRWRRVSQLLKRGGLRIDAESDPMTGMVWWLLPIAGLGLFLASVLFGHKFVDKIWEPPKVIASVVNLNNPNGISEEELAEDLRSEESVAYLQGAFRTSAEQKEAGANYALELDDYIDKQIASVDDIRKYMGECFLDVHVDSRRWRGTLISENGLVFVDTGLLQNAFRRETRTVREDHAIRETAVWVVPEVEYPGRGERFKAERVVDSVKIGLTLLTCNLKGTFSFTAQYYENVEAGGDVWVAKEINGTLYPDKVPVVSNISLNGNEDVAVWVLSTDLGASYAGSPVFNVYGELIGIVVNHNGETAVISLLTLRERAPLIYKSLQ